MSDTSQLISALSPEKRKLFEILSEKEGISVSQTSIGRARKKAHSIPLSFAQERLWFFDQLQPGDPTYNMGMLFHLTGSLNVPALAQSLNAIVQRHQVLRTSFAAMDGRPVQVIAPSLTLTLSMIDLTELPEAEREEKARQQVFKVTGQPFDLTQCPLLRVTLWRLNEKEHIFDLTMHHIISDGLSIQIFSREMAALYRAFSTGQPLLLPELPIQYADFAVWQREWLQGKVLETQLAYWQDQLKDAVTVLALPTDRPRPPVQTNRGTVHRFTLSKGLTRALLQLSRQEGCTLFMTLLAAFNTLLHRYTGQQDILIGTPIASRNRSEIEGLIGLFVNTLVLRTDLSGNPPFRELLRRVREMALGAYAHQDLPFEKLVEELQSERDLSRAPLVQVMFVFQSTPPSALELEGLIPRTLKIDRGTAEFDLALSMRETTQGLKGELEYNTDLFDCATILRLAGHFQTLLESIVADPNRRISDLPFLTEAESKQLLVEWNDTRTEYPQDKCIDELFEAQAKHTPDSVAVIFEDQFLTYQELNRRASQLAHHLQGLGVGPEVLVGICAERSVEMVVGLLGVFKVGGAYLPLDPTYPKERLAFMLKDAQASVLLTLERQTENLPEYIGRVICLDTGWETIARQRVGNPSNKATAHNLAYVIYTSGSTGRPKGVMVSQQALVQYVKAAIGHFGITPDDTILQFASISFDTAAEEIYPCLLSGATLVLRTDTMLDSPEMFFQTCTVQGITVLDLPTAYWHVVVPELEINSLTLPPSLRLVIIGGEATSPERLKAWRACASSHIRLVNTYGPTETTIVATMCDFTGKNAPESAAKVPIGTPIANTQVYILDPSLRPVPIGVPGELHIGGDGLARGYLSRPGLTAEAFIPNPFSDEPGARLHRTGDLVRYLPDGNIEFLGRKDHQVKIRGFRIELGEIETVLAQHPAVREGVVLAREDTLGGPSSPGKRLVAYVVPSDGQQLATADLRRFLQHKLPDYMVPSAFVSLSALPLTPNGKVDRRALPAPDRTRPRLEDTFVAPRTPTEQVLAGIWAHVLGIDQVSIHDTFFELGGHSLLATQVVSRLRHTFQVDLPLRALFEAPTVAGLAERVDHARRTEQGLSVPPILPAPRDGVLPLSFAQQRLWFIDQWEPGNPHYNIPSAMRLSGRLDVAALALSLDEIIRRHQALRTTFSVVQGLPRQVIASHLSVGPPIVDLQHLPHPHREAEARRLATAESQWAFDLARGPLVRAALLRLGDEEHVLLLNMHHIVSDGWSSGVFIHEMAALYRAFSSGKPSPLPQLPIQYADFALWQRHWLQGDVLHAQLAYWRHQLADAPTVLELPTDRPRPPLQTFHGTTESFILPAGLTQALLTLSRDQGCTLFMTLLAAFNALLFRYTGQDDILVGSPIANRNHTEIENLIGFFVNTLVLRTNLSGNPSFRELLHRVRHMTLEAYAHQDLPFEMLVEQLQPERDLSRSPLFQVMFALQNAPTQALELPDVTLSSFRVKLGTAKFDLTLSMLEAQQQLFGSFEYNTDLFDATTIARLADHFQTLLEGIVAHPDQPLADLPILTQAQQHCLLTEWNHTHTDYPRHRCIHELFEAQVERTPDAVAIVFQDLHLTYGQLNLRANQLAHHLQTLGVEPNVLVGICTERSTEMIVGILGTLKAGGAYLPLNPDFPKERLAFMLHDAHTPVLLTQQRLVERLPTHETRIVRLDADWETIARQSQENPITTVTPDHQAYVIYTSGSTGRPKGVTITHANICPLLHWGYQNLRFTPTDRSIQYLSFCFDWSVWEMVITLTTGGCLLLVSDQTVLDAEATLDYMIRNKVTVLHATPTQFQVLTTLGRGLETLQYACIGAEKLGYELVERCHSLLNPSCRMFNMYGPTETAIIATVLELDRSNIDQYKDLTSIPIGQPVANARCYVVDGHNNLQPIGVPGELYIAGDGLARGYLNRAELTADRFVPSLLDARVYRTGDLVKWLPDGHIEFLGRIDHQVKIRGFRIELGEIETVLAQHPAVREGVVLAREDTLGGPSSPGKRLVAYVVPSDGQQLAIADLRRFLSEKLPDYMVPSAFVSLSALPLTPNGKVDRRALPSPEKASFATQTLISPRDTLELGLLRIWEDVLSIRPIGVADNFFNLGGHSLLAVRLMARIQQELGQQLPLATLFQNATVERLAAVLRQHRGTIVHTSLVPIQLGHSNRRPLFFVHPAGGSVFCYTDLCHHLETDQPFYGLQAQGLDGQGEPHTKVEQMASHYIELVQTVQPEGPYLLGGWSMGGVVALEMAQQLQTRGQKVALLALVDSYVPIGIEEPEPSDAVLLRQFAQAVGISSQQIVSESDHFEQLRPDERLGYVLQQAKRANTLPPDVDLAHVRRLFKVFKNNVRAVSRYVPRTFSGSITLYRAKELLDGVIPSEDSGWRSLAAQGLAVHVVPGHHFSMIRMPNVEALAEHLKKHLHTVER